MLPTLSPKTFLTGQGGLQAGEEGWWPVLAQMPRDIRVGDLLTIDGDVMLVTESRPGKDATRWAIVPEGGTVFTIGALYRGFDLDRWGTHAHLADSCR